MDKRIKSAKPRSAVRSRMRSLSDKLLLAMTIDKACGGPLLNFLRRSVYDTSIVCVFSGSTTCI